LGGRARGYFTSSLQFAKDFAQLSEMKLTVPVLAISSDKSLGQLAQCDERYRCRVEEY
jgi:hypothetical protein